MNFIKNKILVFFTIFLALLLSSNALYAEENVLISVESETLNAKPDKIFNVSYIQSTKKNTKPELFVLNDNKFVSNAVSQTGLYSPQEVVDEPHKLIKVEISKSKMLYDEITLNDEDSIGHNLKDLNTILDTNNPCDRMQPLIFQEKHDSPFLNRIKTVYFLTALSTGIGQSGQIEDAFTKGTKLTGGGTSKSNQYGYNNVARNLLNPVSRAIKGARVDDSGPVVNYFQHPLFGFGIASYLTASGASPAEVFLVTMADNFIFEYVVEGTYVAPSGIDFLATTGGCILGYFATKYIFKKPFKKFVDTAGVLKAKYNVSFNPIIEPGYTGSGMRIGSQVTIKH